MRPRPVIMDEFECSQDLSTGGVPGACAEQPLISQATNGCGRLIGDLIEITDVNRPDGGEVTLIGEIGTFGVAQIRRELRNEEIQVRVALPMRMRPHIDRHAVDEGREVSAMIEIETA